MFKYGGEKIPEEKRDIDVEYRFVRAFVCRLMHWTEQELDAQPASLVYDIMRIESLVNKANNDG